MNVCCHVGRLTKTPVVNYTQGSKPMCIARFTLAVDRRFKRDGQPTADFLNFVAFGKTGEFVEEYLDKGVKIATTSHVQTGSYTNKDGQTVYTTEFVVDNLEFAESKSSRTQTTQQTTTRESAPTQGQNMNEFMNIPDAISDSLPFA